MTTAAAIIIGDEILSGKTQDTNSYFLSQTLFEQGVDLVRIEVLPDDIDLISERLKYFKNKVDWVFTSGGIGPTHDDKTYEAVAKACGRELKEDAYYLDKFCKRYGLDKNKLNYHRKKMILFPSPCETLEVEQLWVPVVVVDNICIYPGVPEMFEYMLTQTKEKFIGQKKIRRQIYSSMLEGHFAEDLERIQEEFSELQVGSYPKMNHAEYKVMISVEGRDEKTIDEAAKKILTAVDGYEKI